MHTRAHLHTHASFWAAAPKGTMTYDTARMEIISIFIFIVWDIPI